MRSNSKTALIIALSLTGLALYAHAEPADLNPNELRNTKSGANFMTGGIGREEVEAMRRVAKQYPLQLLLSEGRHGTALTDVAVNITDSTGNIVFKIQHAGPLLYVKLPAGEYKVSGNNNGLKQAQNITLANDVKSQKVYLNWPGLAENEIPEE